MDWVPLGRNLRRVVVVALLMALCSLATTSPAWAHAELRQASPDRNATVGGLFDEIILAFSDLDVAEPYEVQLFDPAGNQIDSEVIAEDQRLILPIEPLEVPGQYLVQYSVTGIDGDFVEDRTFTFTFQPGAPEPGPITFGVEGFDYVNFVLLLLLAAMLAFLVHRFMTAWREHKAASAAVAAVEMHEL